MSQALTDFNNAYTYGIAETMPGQSNTAGAGNLDTQFGSNPITPGIYSWGGALTLTTSATLHGNCSDVFIFQINGALTTAASSKLILTGGVTSSSIYWVVAAAFGTGAGSLFQGNVIAQGIFTLGASAQFIGRGYSHTGISFGASAIAQLPDPCTAPSGQCYSPCGRSCDVTPSSNTTQSLTFSVTSTTTSRFFFFFTFLFFSSGYLYYLF